MSGPGALNNGVREARAASADASWLDLQRQALLGEISAIVVHEFNNLMTPVLALAEQAKSDGQYSERRILSVIEHTQRAVHIARTLLTFAEGDSPPDEVCRLDEMTRAALTPLGRPLIRDKVEIDSRLEDAPPVRGDRQLLQQFILNATVDALEEFRRAGGRIDFDAEARDSEVLWRIALRGANVQTERSSLLAAYFSAGEQRGPTDWKAVGLRMAACREIARVHHARIGVSSEDGVRVLSLSLPRASEACPPSPPAPISATTSR